MTGPPTGEAETVDVVIIGTGGHGRQLHDLIDIIDAVGATPRYRVLGYLDDGEVDVDLLARRGAAHLGGSDRLAEIDAKVVIGVASPADRRRLAAELAAAGRETLSFIHPNVVIGSLTTIGPGAFVSPFTMLDTNVVLGAHVHLSYGVSVGHDSRLGDFITACPGARISGNVTIGDEVFVGTNAAILQGITVGAGARIGAGAVVRRDLPAGVMYSGILAARRPGLGADG